MAVRIHKPILVGGLGLSAALWLWQSLGQSVLHWGELGIVGAIALAGTSLWWQQQQPAKIVESTPIDPEAVQKAIASIETLVTTLEKEAPEQDLTALKNRSADLPGLLAREELQIALIGSQKVGKTALKQELENRVAQKVAFREIEALAVEATATAVEAALASDIILLIVDGDLTDSQWQILQQIKAAHSRIILVFNKQDLYIPEERAAIMQQLRQRVSANILPEDVIAIAAAPTSRKVRQHREDGSLKEWSEQQTAQIEPLSYRLCQIIAAEKQQLICATTWREARGIKAEAKEILNRVRRDRALPIIERYQWIAAAAAFANPVASLDLLATAAISTQMLIDLGEIYNTKLSLAGAKAASGAISKQMLQLGLVELSTGAVSSILKSNAITYLAGGAVQGISAAYLTRLAGLSLVEYCQEQEVDSASQGLNVEKLKEKLQQIFQQNQRTAFLQSFVEQAAARLSLKEAKGKAIAS